MKVKVFMLIHVSDGQCSVTAYGSEKERADAQRQLITRTAPTAIKELLNTGNLETVWETYRSYCEGDGHDYYLKDDTIEVAAKGPAGRRIKQLEKCLTKVRDLLADEAIEIRQRGGFGDEEESDIEKLVNRGRKLINKAMEPRTMYDTMGIGGLK